MLCKPANEVKEKRGIRPARTGTGKLSDCSTDLVELPASPHDGYDFARACSTGLNSGRPNPTRLGFRLRGNTVATDTNGFNLRLNSALKSKHNFFKFSP